MVARGELEGLVTRAIHEIRLAEENLARRYRSLEKTDVGNRLLFECALQSFTRRATQLEHLVNQLEFPSQEMTAA